MKLHDHAEWRGPSWRVDISRGRSADGDHAYVNDVQVRTSNVGMTSEELDGFIDAVQQAQVRHKRWLEEGGNWSVE